MEDKIQQEYLRLVGKKSRRCQNKVRNEYNNYKALLSDDLSCMNFKTRTYDELKELKEELIVYIATVHEDVDQLTYPDYNIVTSVVRTALNNISIDLMYSLLSLFKKGTLTNESAFYLFHITVRFRRHPFKDTLRTNLNFSPSISRLKDSEILHFFL